MTRDHSRYTDDIGAYLLGALEPGEERAFEHHLEGCAICQEDVARLEVARDAIPAAVEQYSPAPELKATLMKTVRAEAAVPRPAAHAGSAKPSRWRDLVLMRPRIAAAAAALMIAIGVATGALIGIAGGGSDAQQQQTVAASIDRELMPAGKASLLIPADAKENGGAILRVEGMQSPPSGHVYEVWIEHDGKVTPSSLFTVERDGHGTAAIPHKLSGVDKVMVTREPEGGSKQPSERPVVMVRLPS